VIVILLGSGGNNAVFLSPFNLTTFQNHLHRNLIEIRKVSKHVNNSTITNIGN